MTDLAAITLFPGGGGVEQGMKAAGLKTLHSYEINLAVAAFAQANGFDTRWGDVLTEPLPDDYGDLFAIHASPPCPSFSQAKTDGKETQMDRRLAQRVCDYIRRYHPRVFTLENVYGYRKSMSMLKIWYTLLEEGYGVNSEHVNMADFGVPQSRKRLIVVAVRGMKWWETPTMPRQTHIKREKMPVDGYFPLGLKPWVSWYEAIEDLLPDCPDSELARWQRKRLPAEYEALLFLTGNTSDAQAAPGVGCQQKDTPAGTVHTHSNGQLPRAVLVGAGSFDGTVVSASIEDPALTVTANHNQGTQLCAVLFSAQSVGGAGPATRDGQDPALTVSTNADRMRAVLIQNQNTKQEWGKGYREGDGSSPSVSAGMPGRAVLFDASNTSRATTLRTEDEPSPTVQAWHGRRPSHAMQVFTGIRTVQLTTRCLARFQTLPDHYILPDQMKLACLIIGNMVPPLYIEILYRHLIGCYA